MLQGSSTRCVLSALSSHRPRQFSYLVAMCAAARPAASSCVLAPCAARTSPSMSASSTAARQDGVRQGCPAPPSSPLLRTMLLCISIKYTRTAWPALPSPCTQPWAGCWLHPGPQLLSTFPDGSSLGDETGQSSAPSSLAHAFAFRNASCSAGMQLVLSLKPLGLCTLLGPRHCCAPASSAVAQRWVNSPVGGLGQGSAMLWDADSALHLCHCQRPGASAWATCGSVSGAAAGLQPHAAGDGAE